MTIQARRKSPARTLTPIPPILDQDLLHTLYDSGALGIAVLSPETRFLDVNSCFSMTTGYTPVELQSLDWLALIHPDEALPMQDLIAELLTGTKRDFSIVQQFCCKDGTLIWLESNVSLVHGAAGQLARLAATCRDVTEQHRVAELVAGQADALTQSVNGASLHEVLEILIQTAQAQSEITGRASFYIVDADGAHLHPLAGSMPESYTQAVDWFPIGPNSPSCGLAAHTGQPVIVRDVALDPLWAPYLSLAEAHGFRACWSFPLLSFDGKVLGTLALYHSHPREPEQQDLDFVRLLSHTASGLIARHKVEMELRAASLLKDEFISLVSHELRSPVTTIYGYARLLLEKGDRLSSDDVGQALRDIEEQSARLSHIIDDLLILARPENGGPPKAPISVLAVLRSVIEEHRKAYPDRDIDLSEEFSDVLATGSEDYLGQIARNLVGNAEKYSPAEQPIHISVQLAGNEIQIDVRDHGAGVPEQEAEAIFKSFYRAPSTATKAAGMGLGLAVCKRLVEAQHGRIWVQPAADGGAMFCFTLKACAAPA